MVQVQSTWFPLIDRNPQKFVANIFKAGARFYPPAAEEISGGEEYALYVQLQVRGVNRLLTRAAQQSRDRKGAVGRWH